MLKRILPISIIMVLAWSAINAQSLDSIKLFPDTAMTCDSADAILYGQITNTNQNIDSNSVKADTQITLYMSSSGIGVPTITSFTDTIALGKLNPGQQVLTAYLEYNGSKVDTVYDTVNISSCGIHADFSTNDTNLCLDQKLKLTNESYSYDSLAWYKDSVYFSSKENPQTNFSDTGTHQVKLIAYDTAANNSDTLKKNIEVNPVPDINITPSSICGGKSDTLSIQQKGYNQYEWKRNGALLSNEDSSILPISKSGTYTGIATNISGCQDSDTTEASSIVNLGSDTSSCKGDTLVIDAGNPNGSHTWQDNSGGQTYEATTSGTYYVEVDDGAGCQGYDTVNLTFNDTPYVNLGPDTAICNSKELILDAGNPGATHVWNDNDTSKYDTVNKTGIYSVDVTNSQGCKDSDSIDVTVHPLPKVTLGSNDTICGNDSIILDAGSYRSYSWQDQSSDSTLTAKNTGQYHVTVKDSNGCQNSDTTFIQNYSNPQVSLRPDTSICEGDSLTLDPGNDGIDTYNWQDNSNQQTFTVNSTGNYHVTATDTNGCQASDTTYVQVHQVADLNIGPHDTLLCGNEQLVMDAGSVWDAYLWQDFSTSRKYTASSAGTYHVTVTDSNDCKNYDTVTINTGNRPDPGLGQDSTFCEGDSLILYPGNWSSYKWHNGSSDQVYIADSSELVKVTVTNNAGCPGQDSLNVKKVQRPEINIVNDTAICEGDSLILNAGNDGTNYTWQDGSIGPVYTVMDSGMYHVDVLNNANCITRDTAHVKLNPKPQVELMSDTGLCPGDSLQLNAGAKWKAYTWQDGSSGQSFTVTGVGTYHVTVTDSLGCSGRDTTEVQGYDKPQPALGADTTVCESDGIVLNADSQSSYQYTWQDGSTGSNYQLDTLKGEYDLWVRVTSGKNCKASDSITITVEDCVNSISERDQLKFEVYPNPVKDELKVTWPAELQQKEDKSISILDLNGQQVKTIQDFPSNKRFTRLKVGDLPKGQYIILFTTTDKMSAKKLIVQ